MTTPRYLTVAAFQEWARDETADSTVITQAINAAEEMLDHEAGRPLLVASGTATARKFVPDPGSESLRLPDMDSVTSIVENGTTLTEGTHYQLEPLNQLGRYSQNYRPDDRAVRIDGSYWYTNLRTATVTVTADWGWSAIPAVVIEACKVLTLDWLSMRDVRHGTVGIGPDGFTVGIRNNPVVTRAISAVAGYGSWSIA